ncbi:MAG: hypothetical protein AB7O96_15500 [Pseudobdellovibrionaceae bacterium]
MMKHIANTPVIFLYATFFGLSACSSLSKKSSEKFLLEVKGEPGRREVLEYISKSLEQKYFEDGVMKEQESTTRFAVAFTTLKVEPEKVFFKVESLAHEGAFELEDLAFPPKGEPMDLVLTTKEGKVLKAGDYPQNSTFYVPPVPLPKGPVQIGDSWKFETQWVNMKTGAPFVLEMAVIFKDVETCGSQKCAVLDVSGDVALNIQQQSVGFSSELTGWMRFGLTSGSLDSTEIRSSDKLQTAEGMMKIYSCLGIRRQGRDKSLVDCQWPSPNN